MDQQLAKKKPLIVTDQICMVIICHIENGVSLVELAKAFFSSRMLRHACRQLFQECRHDLQKEGCCHWLFAILQLQRHPLPKTKNDVIKQLVFMFSTKEGILCLEERPIWRMHKMLKAIIRELSLRTKEFQEIRLIPFATVEAFLSSHAVTSNLQTNRYTSVSEKLAYGVNYMETMI